MKQLISMLDYDVGPDDRLDVMEGLVELMKVHNVPIYSEYQHICPEFDSASSVV